MEEILTFTDQEHRNVNNISSEEVHKERLTTFPKPSLPTIKESRDRFIEKGGA